MLSIRKAAIVWLKRTAKVAWEVPLSLERVTIVVLSLSVGALIVAMVVCRYFLEIPLMWVEEIVLYIIFWCYILGAAYATYERTHIKGGVVHLVIKDHPRVLACFQVGVALLCLGLSGLFTVWGYTNFIWNLEINARSTHLFLPLAYSYLSLPVGFLLMTVYFLSELIASVRGLRSVPTNSAPRGGQ